MMEKTDMSTALPMPMLALRGLVAFPKVTFHFDVKRKKSILAIKAAMDLDRKILIVTQSDINVEEPTLDDLYKVGVVCNIKQLIKADNDTVRVLIEGEYKAKIVNLIAYEPFFMADIKRINLSTAKKLSPDEEVVIIRLVKKMFKEYCYSLPNVPRDIITRVLSRKAAEELFPEIFPNILTNYEEKQKLLECNNNHQMLELLAEILERECSLLDIEHDLYEKVRDKMDKNQRDYFLREQQRIISEELNEGDSPLDDADEFSDKIYSIKNISEESRERLLKECDKLARMPMQSQEASVIRSYLEICLDLPFDTFTKDTLDIAKARKQLDNDHYGLDKVKDRILELLSVRKLKPDVKGQIICLVGPPGVGKTSIASSIARALNRRYVRLSLGGVNDESEIRGHRKTYLGSMPGRIIQAFRQAKTYNPLILLDEIDKMSSDFRGDPASAMLEVLDSEQNNSFVDHYIEIPFDLSKALFITTANTLQSIPTPLLDRMEVIELASYTREEKFNIARRHLVKKQIEKNGLTTKQLVIKDSALYEILDCYTREAGVRNLERKLGSICRKTAKYIVSGEQEKVVVTDKNIEEFLSARRYKKTPKESKDMVGVVNGLAWTSVGGEMLEIECSVMEGTGKVKLTGSLGDVMKESADIAISYVRTIASEYNIKSDFYKTCDIHIHAPEGAVPKDGPSAGVTMVTALVSALANIPVRGDLAMTGEISLRGRVMPIGGLKEKSMAAYREQKKVVLIPKENESDLNEIDKTVRESIQFIPMEKVSEVLEIALVDQKNRSITEELSKWCNVEPTAISHTEILV